MLKKHNAVVAGYLSFFLLTTTLSVNADLVKNLSDSSVIPHGLLLLKHYPELISEKQLLGLSRQQVGRDQWSYENSKDGHVYMFHRNQIVGRPTNFVARELVPEYRGNLLEYAQSVPDDIYVEDVSRLDYRIYKDGKLQLTKNHIGGWDEFEILDKKSILSKQQKLKFPPLGNYEILMSGIPRLNGSFPSSLPVTIRDLGIIHGTKGYLALNRKPILPSIELDAKTAEALWAKPDCSMIEGAYFAEMSHVDAKLAARECQKKWEKYGKSEIKTIYHLTIADVVLSDNRWVVKAKINSVEVHGPGQRLLRRYSPSELPPAEDTWREQKQALELEEQKKQAKIDSQKAEAKASHQAVKQFLDEQRRMLSSADITDLHLGMNINDAEEQIRNKMDIGWTLINTTEPRINHKDFLLDPLSEFRGYVRSDGTEHITLFGHADYSHDVFGIARKVLFPETVSDDRIYAQLSEKYGTPISKNGSLVWTADFGQIDRQGFELSDIEDIEDAYKYGACRASLFGALRNYIQNSHGEELTLDEIRKIKSSLPMIRISGGGNRNKSEPFESETWEKCGPMVVAYIDESHEDGYKELTVGLLDLSEYADVYEKRIQENQSSSDLSVPEI